MGLNPKNGHTALASPPFICFRPGQNSLVAGQKNRTETENQSWAFWSSFPVLHLLKAFSVRFNRLG
ncbi:MAG: hypothetical protein JWQ08_2748 [Deinococcus sp.]|nr:hypothetical protein [Deinococcus sp.]